MLDFGQVNFIESRNKIMPKFIQQKCVGIIKKSISVKLWLSLRLALEGKELGSGTKVNTVPPSISKEKHCTYF